jgi:hypothetical protein
MIKYFVFIFFISCNFVKEKKGESVINNKPFNHYNNDSTIDFINCEGEYKNIKDSVFYNFIKYFGIDTTVLGQNALEKITETKSFKFLGDSSTFNYYEVKLKNKPSEVWRDNYGFLFNVNENKYCVIGIDESFIINIGKNNYCLVGFVESNSKGVFTIYNMHKNRLKQIFVTNEFIINKSSDCIIYQPFQLITTYEDINKDSLLDLAFTGNYLNFCEGLEDGPNYYTGDSIKTHGRIKYVYLQHSKGNQIVFKIDSNLSKFPRTQVIR